MQPPDPNQPQNTSNNQPYAQPQAQPQQMYYTRPLDPQQPVMSEEIRQKHEASKSKYSKLNLSEGEYVISDVRRHPIGLVQIWLTVTMILAIVLGLLTLLVTNKTATASSIPVTPLAVGALLVCGLALIVGYVGAYVYTENKLYLTNETVTQNIQISLFSKRVQTVSLGNIEDASYTKKGIIQNLLDFGSLRLSTQGDETTYRFNYASHPAQQIAILNNAVEAFKNGRPIQR